MILLSPYDLNPSHDNLSYLTLPYLTLPLDVEEQEPSEQDDLYFRLRPVTSQDFAMAIKKLKASVDDSGKEIMKVRSVMFTFMLMFKMLSFSCWLSSMILLVNSILHHEECYSSFFVSPFLAFLLFTVRYRASSCVSYDVDLFVSLCITFYTVVCVAMFFF